MLIAFSGVDCAGKSTHIKLLQQYLASHGKSCTVLWYRPGYSGTMQKCKDLIRSAVRFAGKNLSLHQLISRRNSSRQALSAQTGSDTCKKWTPPPAVWMPAAFVDTAAEWGIRLRYLLKKYDVVICDRYFEDARLDILFKYPDNVWGEHIFAPLKNIVPKPDISLMLWLPYETVIERAEKKDEPFPDDPEIRRLRYRAYEFLADEDENIITIDASGSVDATHQKIIDAVSPALKSSKDQLDQR